MKLIKRVIAFVVCSLMLSTVFALGGSTLKELVKLEKDQKASKAAYSKSKANVEAKHKYAVATVKLGTATMGSDALDRKVKYVRALRLYREALKVEPNNAEAKNNAQLIEDIYRSMHRPIPR